MLTVINKTAQSNLRRGRTTWGILTLYLPGGANVYPNNRPTWFLDATQVCRLEISINSASVYIYLNIYSFLITSIHLSITSNILKRLCNASNWLVKSDNLLLLWQHSFAAYGIKKWNSLLHFSEFLRSANFIVATSYTYILHTPKGFHRYIMSCKCKCYPVFAQQANTLVSELGNVMLLNGQNNPPYKGPLLKWAPAPHLIHDFFGPLQSPPKWHLNRVSYFCKVYSHGPDYNKKAVLSQRLPCNARDRTIRQYTLLCC